MPVHGIRPVLDFTGTTSKTVQSMKDETDINNIVRRFDRDGVITHLRTGVPNYCDVSELPSYREALDTVIRAEANFMELPSEVRAEFDNDPALWVDAIRAGEAERRSLEALEAALKPADAPKVPEVPQAPPEPSEGD